MACQSVRSALAGMRRADYVRMVEADRLQFFVVGTGRHVPVEREVTPGVALQLLGSLPVRYQHTAHQDAEVG